MTSKLPGLVECSEQNQIIVHKEQAETQEWKKYQPTKAILLDVLIDLILLATRLAMILLVAYLFASVLASRAAQSGLSVWPVITSAGVRP